MSTIAIYDAVTEKLAGTTHIHGDPQIGNALDWHGGLWRILDVIHPTEDQDHIGIHVARVYVAAQPVGIHVAAQPVGGFVAAVIAAGDAVRPIKEEESMDPDASLEEIRQILFTARRRDERDDGMTPTLHEAERLATLFAALDEWISRGGFLPVSWQQDRPQERAVAPSRPFHYMDEERLEQAIACLNSLGWPYHAGLLRQILDEEGIEQR